jgi:low temperature requirement protein LtrA
MIGVVILTFVLPVSFSDTAAGHGPNNLLMVVGHIAERFRLLTIITLGEVVAATTSAVGALVEAQGWSVAAVVIASSGLVLAASLWWAYFLIPARPCPTT